MAALARMAGFSPGHFHRLMLARAGLTPMEKLFRLRMEMAASLLLKTSLPLPEIAERVGYASACAFSDAFRRFSGERPGKYRRRVAGPAGP